MDIICLAQFRQNVKYKHGQVDTLRKWILIIRSQFCPLKRVWLYRNRTEYDTDSERCCVCPDNARTKPWSRLCARSYATGGRPTDRWRLTWLRRRLSLQADANEHLRQRATYDDGNYAQQHRGRAAAQADDHFRGPQLDPACPFGGNVSFLFYSVRNFLLPPRSLCRWSSTGNESVPKIMINDTKVIFLLELQSASW